MNNYKELFTKYYLYKVLMTEFPFRVPNAPKYHHH